MSAEESIAQVSKIIDDITKNTLGDIVKETVSTVRNILRQLVHARLGIKVDSFGRVQEDESGSSYIAGVIDSVIRKEVDADRTTKKIARMVDEVIKIEQKEVIRTITDSARYEYRRRIKDKVELELKARAEKDAATICEAIKSKVGLLFERSKVDISDPDQFGGKLGELVLERVAEELAIQMKG